MSRLADELIRTFGECGLFAKRGEGVMCDRVLVMAHPPACEIRTAFSESVNRLVLRTAHHCRATAEHTNGHVRIYDTADFCEEAATVFKDFRTLTESFTFRRQLAIIKKEHGL